MRSSLTVELVAEGGIEPPTYGL
uniref:Uncharacterized protein n=1 Tax=mine drainage metagenome TaxID=410659 RepID=E6QK72_9ZZZZ